MDVIIISNLIRAVIVVVNFYLFFMFIVALMTLLAVFRVIDLFNENIWSNIYFTIKGFIDPVLNFVSRFVPRVGVFDLPFLVLLVLLWIIKDMCYYFLANLGAGSFTF